MLPSGLGCPSGFLTWGGELLRGSSPLGSTQDKERRTPMKVVGRRELERELASLQDNFNDRIRRLKAIPLPLVDSAYLLATEDIYSLAEDIIRYLDSVEVR